MYKETEFFKDKKADTQKLVSFCFFRKEQGYIYQQPILDGMFVLCVLVSGDRVFTSITDTQSKMEYRLHNVHSANGKFVGKVRIEYEQILTNIRDKCFVSHVFKTQIAADVIKFAFERFGDQLEFLWNRPPAAAVLRHKVSRKWYAIFMKIPAQRLGVNDESYIEILNLKVKPENIAKTVVDKIKFFPAYHMNKSHWITINLNKIDHMSEIMQLILESYSLVYGHNSC